MNINSSKKFPVQKAAVREKVMNLSPSQKSLYGPVWDAQIPRGKFQGRTLKYIYDNESWYFDWLEKNELLYEWELYQLKDGAMRPVTRKPTGFYSQRDNCYWIGLREI